MCSCFQDSVETDVKNENKVVLNRLMHLIDRQIVALDLHAVYENNTTLLSMQSQVPNMS